MIVEGDDEQRAHELTRLGDLTRSRDRGGTGTIRFARPMPTAYLRGPDVMARFGLRAHKPVLEEAWSVLAADWHVTDTQQSDRSRGGAERAMEGKIGDRIVVESEKVGVAPREGEILEVIEAPYGTTYLVRWADGHESTFQPTAGSARIMPAETSKRR